MDSAPLSHLPLIMGVSQLCMGEQQHGEESRGGSVSICEPLSCTSWCSPCHLPGCHSPATLPTTGRLGLVTLQAQSHETAPAMTLSAPKLAENFTWTPDTLFFLARLHISGLADIGRGPHLGLHT